MGNWSRIELQEAHDAFIAAAAESGRTGDWSIWAQMFTEDATYKEHLYGEFSNRAEIEAWITATMAAYPNNEMTEFPHDWCVCDEERGWWLCQIQNRMNDPGDGEIYQEYNWTLLKYAGDGQFSYEEDIYNPASFAPMIQNWIAARAASDQS